MRDLTEEDIKHEASEDSQQDWDCLSYRKVHMDAFVRGAKFAIEESGHPKSSDFDITEYEFSDKMSNLKAMLSERGDVVIRIGSSWIFLDKDDAIAIAKALSVTGEDLR